MDSMPVDFVVRSLAHHRVRRRIPFGGLVRVGRFFGGYIMHFAIRWGVSTTQAIEGTVLGSLDRHIVSIKNREKKHFSASCAASGPINVYHVCEDMPENCIFPVAIHVSFMTTCVRSGSDLRYPLKTQVPLPVMPSAPISERIIHG